MKLIKILSILSIYGLDENYPLWAEHDINSNYFIEEIMKGGDVNE